MTDWTQLYLREVAPAMERFAAPTPMGVWLALGALAAVGLALVVFASGSWRLSGLVPLGLAGFIAFMVIRSGARAELPARYRVGVVEGLRVERTVGNNAQGIGVATEFWMLDLRTTETAHFDASGSTPLPDAPLGLEALVISQTLFSALEQGSEGVFISYPGAEQAVAFSLDSSGAAIH